MRRPRTAKTSQTPPRNRQLYTPEPVRRRVVAMHVAGQSNRDTAKVEQIDRETVGRILSQQEAVEMIARQRSRLQSLADNALDLVERALHCEDASIAVPVAMKIIENVFPKGTTEQIFGALKKASPEAEGKERRLRILAEILDGTLDKSAKYNLLLPPEMIQIKEQLQRRLNEAGPEQ